MKTYQQILFLAIGAIMLAAGVNHFILPDFYVPMMPPYFGDAKFWVLITGVPEIILGIGCLIPRFRAYSALGLVVLMVAFFPVHWYMVQAPGMFPKLPVAGLWIRFFMQFALVFLFYRMYVWAKRAA